MDAVSGGRWGPGNRAFLHQLGQQVGQGAGGVGAAAGVHGRGLHHGAAGGREPAKPLGRRHTMGSTSSSMGSTSGSMGNSSSHRRDGMMHANGRGMKSKGRMTNGKGKMKSKSMKSGSMNN